jgi:protease PrsW
MIFYAIALPLAFVPSIIWLLFYLRRDVHPEPNRLVIKTFLLSMAITIAMAFCLIGLGAGNKVFLEKGIDLSAYLPILLVSPLGVIFFNAFWEEVLKYTIVRFSIIRRPEFDEPVDAMEYMIISALGFAAIENILVVLNNDNLEKVIGILFARFLGATFIHALASAVVGFFLARAIFHKKNRRRFPLRIGYVLMGLLIASLLHGAFNFLIIKSEDLSQKVILYCLAVFLAVLAWFVIRALRILNKQSLKNN